MKRTVYVIAATPTEAMERAQEGYFVRSRTEVVAALAHKVWDVEVEITAISATRKASRDRRY